MRSLVSLVNHDLDPLEFIRSNPVPVKWHVDEELRVADYALHAGELVVSRTQVWYELIKIGVWVGETIEGSGLCLEVEYPPRCPCG